MRILVFSDLNDAVWRLRIGFHLERLRASGRISDFRRNQPDSWEWADLVVFQRLYPLDTALQERLLAGGKAVVYETDDLLWRLPRRHPEHFLCRGKAALFWALLRRTAAGITVSTPYLQRRTEAPGLPAACIANTLPWPPQSPGERRPGPLRIGFFGTATHERDFAFLADGPARWREACGRPLHLHFMGLPPPFRPTAGCEYVFHPFIADYETYLEYARGLQLDIALAPLADTPFNRAKSAVKYLEYTHMGTVGVYSAVGPYRGLTGGEVCRNRPAEWSAAVARLAASADYRAQVWRRAAAEIGERFDAQREADRLLAFYQRLAETPRRFRRPVVEAGVAGDLRRLLAAGESLPFLEGLACGWAWLEPRLRRGRRWASWLRPMRPASLYARSLLWGICARLAPELGHRPRVRLPRADETFTATPLDTLIGWYRVASLLAPTRPTAARRIFTLVAAVERHPGLQAGAMFHLARLLLEAGERTEARQWLHRCLQLEPDHWRAAELAAELAADDLHSHP